MATLFVNSSCVLCGDSVSEAISLCIPCKKDLPILENACQKCALPLDKSNEHNSVCGQCIQSPSLVDYTFCLYHYQTPMDFLITDLKYNQQLSHAQILGELLSEYLQSRLDKDDLPDCIIPVPLYKNRLVKRGFNQSLEIARPVAKHFKLPIDIKSVKRNRQTVSQADLNAQQRKKNVKGCFELKNKTKIITHKHVVIIDDVMTTGSTIYELASLLKKSGATKVGVWSIARAVLG